MEFTNLLNSARPSQTPSFPTMSSFPEVKNNSSFGASQTNGPPVFSSFSQIGAATNIGPGPGYYSTSSFVKYAVIVLLIYSLRFTM